MRHSCFAILLLSLAACNAKSSSGEPATKERAPREVHTAAYDLIIHAEQKALPLLRRSGFAKAQ
jgi:hypothetical protein